MHPSLPHPHTKCCSRIMFSTSSTSRRLRRQLSTSCSYRAADISRCDNPPTHGALLSEDTEGIVNQSTDITDNTSLIIDGIQQRTRHATRNSATNNSKNYTENTVIILLANETSRNSTSCKLSCQCYDLFAVHYTHPVGFGRPPYLAIRFMGPVWKRSYSG